MKNQVNEQITYDKYKNLANRLPPRFFLVGSIGAGKALICLTGGGSSSLSSFCSTSARSESPTAPSDDSWKLSTRAARLHLAAMSLAALRRRS